MQFDQAYNQADYLAFLGDKFDFRELSQPITITDNAVEKFEQLGFITTKDNKKLPIFEAHIKPQTQLAKNRVGLRNLVLKEIKKDTSDGALAVYIDQPNQQWRFSFMTLEPKFDDKGNIIIEQTPNKRYTYLLGKDTQTRTATERFAPLNKQSTLEHLKDAFAVEPLSKEFYKKLYDWYKKAQAQVIFPNDEKAKNHTQTSLIRLITRLLFIWFLKEKHLINPDLFNRQKVQNIIDHNKLSSFYKAILQNLFFATLNRKIEDRSFRRTTNNNPNATNYLATNIYRYQSYFNDTDEQAIIALFKQTPFLNGGLFECLDREASDKEKLDYQQNSTIRKVGSAIRTDGFSDRDDNELKFDNSLFFNDDENGLIDLLGQYQFTTTESTPADMDIALDPELLGKVFENLLAAYNPETKVAARKATGSYYTPREIVEYMVNESLKQYFMYHTNLTKNQANDLLTEKSSTLSEPQIKNVITAIDKIKILDPAVGSGAFPMGILQKLVFVLEKIDPQNIYFKVQQLEKAQHIPDENSRNGAIKAIEQVFSQENQHNTYGKKLMLIENAIYGVDIQPIAIQICKLRFFISLAIEQGSNDKPEENYGVKALPNLETKFIVADSLLPLGKIPDKGQLGLFDDRIKQLRKQLAKVRRDHFNAKTLKTKRKKRQKDKEIRQDMLNTLKGEPGITPEIEASMQKVVDWDLYNPDAVAAWFDPEWQFGIKNGFNIVLGNPPYATYGLDARYRTISQAVNFKFDGIQRNSRNLFAYFIEKAIMLLANKATLTFIVPHSVSRVDGYRYIRKFINDNTILWQIVDEYNQFENVTLEMVTLFCSKNIDKPKYIESFSRRKNETYKLPNNIYDVTGYYPIYYDDIYKKITQNKINKISGYRGFNGIQGNGGNLLYIGGRNIKAYNIELGHGEHNIKFNLSLQSLKREEIVITQFGASPRGVIIDTAEVIPSDGCVIITHKDDLLPKFVLSIINSKIIRYFFDRYVMNSANLTIHLDGHYLRKIPIPKISKTAQQPFINLVNKILTKKQAGENTTDLETQIDQLVYNLYQLTADEIKIIEN